MKFSIITVTYNCLSDFLKTQASVSAQTGVDIEYIVVDGNSKDGTKNAISESKTVTKWISEPDKGIYDAMNKGIDMTSGEAIIFLNAGDYFVGDVLKKVKSAPSLIPVRYKRFSDKERVMPVKSWKNGLPYCHQGIIFPGRKDIKYDLKYRVCADYDYYLRLGLGDLEFAFSPDSDEYIYYDNEGFSVQNAHKRDLEIAEIIQKNFGGVRATGFKVYAAMKRAAKKLILRATN
jgi:putative colanic acid biosynthesis glycosyltransferase